MPNYEILDVLSDKKVLCLEDEISILKNITETLQLFFGEVVGVKDGLEALEKALTNSYDVLIFDIAVPYIDGFEVVKQIRQKDKKIPIIILSSYAEKEHLFKAIDLKISKYLQKPYDKDMLLKALECVSLEIIENQSIVNLKDYIKYDFKKKIIYKNGTSICLSKSESRLLEYFLNHKNQSISYTQLFDYMWEFDQPTKEAIKAIIKEIRKKTSKELIKNLYGVGYLYEA